MTTNLLNMLKSTGRLPNPWIAVLLAVAILTGGELLARWEIRRHMEITAFVCIVVFAAYTYIYRGTRFVFYQRGLFAVLMVAGPWLSAAVNLWGEVVAPALSTTALIAGLLTAVSIGTTEELLFRGILFRAFQGKSMALYVLASSLTFGLLHFQQGYIIVAIAGIVGISYALARVAGCPLGLLIVCHAATDFPHLFPHTAKDYHGVAALGALFLNLLIAVAFFSRRTSWKPNVGSEGYLHDSR